MTADDLVNRVERICAAIGTAQERGMSKFPAKVIRGAHGVAFLQDFRGGLGPAEMENIAYSVTHNIANLRDHLRRWAARNGKDKTKVDACFDSSRALKLIQDLSNNDKHGYPPRDGRGHSGVAPRLSGVDRSARLQPEPGSCVTMTLGPGGVPVVSRSGRAAVVITGEVADKDGNRIADLLDVEEDAVKAWEALLHEFGLP